MNAIHLNGNVWIKCLNAKVRGWVTWLQDVSVRSGRVSFGTLCMHACMCIWCVFNCGFKLLSGRLIRSICMGIHIWKYLQITFCIFHYGFRAEMKSYAGTLTTKHVARLVTLYMRERMYATVSTARNKFFLSLWGRTARACIMIITIHITTLFLPL